MNICIFGGSFDPPHLAHVMLADYMTKQADVDSVWLMVSPHNPLKSEPRSSFEDRFEMCRIATQRYPDIMPSDFEASLKPPYYTIRTLAALKEKYPQHTFSLLIGGDNAEIISQWKDYDRLLDEFKVYAYPRKGISPENLDDRITLIDAPNTSDISSSEIRQRIREGRPVNNLISQEVEEYIRQNGTYR